VVPLIIIDTTNRSDLDEFIRLQEHLPPGDVDSQWGQLPGGSGRVALVLSFKKPIESTAVLEFDIVRQGILVDQIVTAKLLYLQSGRPGDRFITNPDAPRIFVEVLAGGFREHWDKLFHKQLAKHFRATGLGRQMSKEAARKAIMEMRDFGRFRMPSH
jgi:hypothetical protein